MWPLALGESTVEGKYSRLYSLVVNKNASIAKIVGMRSGDEESYSYDKRRS